MTYGELKTYLDGLSPEQLQQPAVCWADGGGGLIDSTMVLEENFINVGDGMEPESAYTADPDFDRDEIIATMPKGSVILFLDDSE